jgi:SAM-dependent methyltransferase
VAAEQVAQQLAFLTVRLPDPPARVLDAGCGTGELAAALLRLGYDVTAVDIDLEAVAEARASGVPAVCADVTDFDDAPFDAIVFSLSLHHVDQLRSAIARARRLLKPTGLIVVDEFAWENADLLTAAWFYDMAAVLDSAGLLRSARGPVSTDDPLERWRRRHHDEHYMHPGDAIRRATAEAFAIREEVRLPYLHRYLGGWLAASPNALATFKALRELESARIRRGDLRPLGLRLVARYAGEDN